MVKRKIMDNNNNNSDLFICFTSRLSSASSMKKQLSSKSILSPNRNNDSNNKQISLSSSLSRRLKNNGSLKGGQSPMFLSKKRGAGSGFDKNQEPTSPKVTCIGQVRVKSKKKQLQQQQLGLKMRSISTRKTGEVSFRRIENCNIAGKQDQILITGEGLNQRNQKWVHLPLTICEALKGFGSEFNCFSSCLMKDLNQRNQKWVHLPLTICEALKGFGSEFNCFSSCLMKEEEDKNGGQNGGSSCGRWFVVGERREIGLIVRREHESGVEMENKDEEDEVEHRKSSYRKRNVMEDIDIDEIERCNDERRRSGGLKDENDDDDDDDDQRRVSFCVPPKNALLLMRCRSDPVKVAALTNKFWESSSTAIVIDDEEDKLLGEDEIEKDDENVLEETEDGDLGSMEVNEIDEISPLQAMFDEIDHHPDDEFVEECSESVMNIIQNSSETRFISPEEEKELNCEIEVKSNNQSFQQDFDNDDDDEIVESLYNLFDEDKRLSTHSEAETFYQIEKEEKTEDGTTREKHEETEEISLQQKHQHEEEETSTTATLASEKRLPDCLLLMMCEPKLSMEVSKETWVCSTDFIKCLPPTRTEKKKTSKIMKRVSIDSNPGYIIQPARASCSFPLNSPAPILSMGQMVGTKFSNSTAAGGYQPLGLTRCKSEPMRKPAKFAPPEGCFWKDKKFEPHQRGAAAGVGY